MKKIINYFENLQLFGAGDVVHATTGYVNANDPAASQAYTDKQGLSPENKTFYDKQLIKTASPHLIHDQFGQERDIPKNGGKTIEFRRFASLPKALDKLTEGVTPKGNKLNVSTVTATVDQYGDYIETSDVMDLTAIDKLATETVEIIGDQAGRTLDTITRNVLHTGTVVQFAHKSDGTAIEARSNLDVTCKLTVDEVKRAKAYLSSVNAPKIDGAYVAVINPLCSYDLMSDNAWIDVAKYADSKRLLDGEIGTCAGVRFVETSEAKVYAPAVIFDGNRKLTVKTAIAETSTSVVVVEEIGETVSSCEIECYIDGVKNKITAMTKDSSNHCTTLTVETAISSLDVGDIVCGIGGTKNGLSVFGTLIMGKNAYGKTSVNGGGLTTIIKGVGEGEDPLNQRSTIGWKALKTAEILVPEYLLRLESCGELAPEEPN